MAASDGGHIWPPRASDPRMQELTGGTEQTTTPDDVFKALRAEGYTGSLDDMWNQHKVTLGVGDTSEPFEDSVAGGSPKNPSDFVLTETWTDGGATYDLNALITDQASAKITSFDMTQDGLKLALSNDADDDIYVYDLSVAFDFSTAVLSSTRAFTNPAAFRWNQLGNNYSLIDSSDDMKQYAAGTAYEVAAGDTLQTQADKSEFGSTGSPDGNCWFNADGSKAYMLVLVGSQSSIGQASLGTAYDLDSITGVVTLDIEPPVTGLSRAQSFRQTPDDKWLYTNYNETLYVGEYGTAGDISTLVLDTVETLDLSAPMVGTLRDIWLADDRNTIYVASDTPVKIFKFEYIP